MVINMVGGGSGGTQMAELPSNVTQATAAQLPTGTALWGPDGKIIQGTATKNGSVSVSLKTTGSGGSWTGTPPVSTSTANFSHDFVSGNFPKYIDTSTNFNSELTVQIPAGRLYQGRTITPSTSQQTAIAAEGCAYNAITVSGDSNLVSSNIKSGISIFGVSGSYGGSSVYHTSGNATYYNSTNIGFPTDTDLRSKNNIVVYFYAFDSASASNSYVHDGILIKQNGSWSTSASGFTYSYGGSVYPFGGYQDNVLLSSSLIDLYISSGSRYKFWNTTYKYYIWAW